MTKRKRFRQLIQKPGMVLAPGAYDALSARIIEAQGFEAVFAGGYAAIGSMLGEPDIGQCNVRDYADHYGRISAAVDVPVYVDGDTGFGGVHNIRHMVRARCVAKTSVPIRYPRLAHNVATIMPCNR